MRKLNTKNFVELTIVGVLTIVFILIKDLELVSEQVAQTFGIATVIFIWGIALLYLYRWVKDVSDDLKGKN